MPRPKEAKYTQSQVDAIVEALELAVKAGRIPADISWPQAIAAATAYIKGIAERLTPPEAYLTKKAKQPPPAKE